MSNWCGVSLKSLREIYFQFVNVLNLSIQQFKIDYLKNNPNKKFLDNYIEVDALGNDLEFYKCTIYFKDFKLKEYLLDQKDFPFVVEVRHSDLNLTSKMNRFSLTKKQKEEIQKNSVKLWGDK